MATKKHMNYDSDEAMTLRGSKIPKAIMASEGTRFDRCRGCFRLFRP